MSVNKMIVPGFGVGNFYGVPNTLGVGSTATVAIPAGQWLIATTINAGASIGLYGSTSSGTTVSYVIGAGVIGSVLFSDGQSLNLQNTTTSVNVVLVPLN